MKKTILFCTTMLLSACSLAPDTVVPGERVPAQWNAATSVQQGSAAWSDFGSAELNDLITRALAHNTDLAAAKARIDQARAATRIAGSGLYPQVEASGSAGRTRRESIGRNDTSQAQLNIAYELDLWRKNSNMLDSALWDLRATQYDRDALTLTVSSEVARLYIGVLAYDARLAVAGKNLANIRDILRITELRYKEGAISGLELAQQRTTVANTEAAIHGLQNERALFFNQLAQLTGVAPVVLAITAQPPMQQLTLGPVPLNDPWALLTRRPDIAAAEARLRAANLDIGVARAQALPSLSLALNAGVTGNPSGSVVGLAASFFAPIFRGGALQGEIDRTKAVRNEVVANYEGALLNSFREVEDALSTFDAATKRVQDFKLAAEAAGKAATISAVQFKEGSIDYPSLILTQNAQLQADDAYLSAVQARLAAQVDLIRALGGPV
jgi:multidrug efflux system outer membrane protein